MCVSFHHGKMMQVKHKLRVTWNRTTVESVFIKHWPEMLQDEVKKTLFYPQKRSWLISSLAVTSMNCVNLLTCAINSTSAICLMSIVVSSVNFYIYLIRKYFTQTCLHFTLRFRPQSVTWRCAQTHSMRSNIARLSHVTSHRKRNKTSKHPSHGVRLPAG